MVCFAGGDRGGVLSFVASIGVLVCVEWRRSGVVFVVAVADRTVETPSMG